MKCYTEKLGVKTYLVRGVLKNKKGPIKAAYFQPLTQLTLEANHKQKSNLHSLKEVHVSEPYKSIHTDIVKQSIVLFLSEILTSSIQEEEENTVLFEYLETAFLWLDAHDKIANFHLLFLLNLTPILRVLSRSCRSRNRPLVLIWLKGVFQMGLRTKMQL